jgi:DNA-binding transcriptional regulator YhcF (GntR family)
VDLDAHVAAVGSPERSGPPKQAADHIVRTIACRVGEGRIRPGDRLPPERELARHFCVSRPTARAALRTLAALGITRSRQGAGTFVAAAPHHFGSRSLGCLAALHHFSGEAVRETLHVLERASAGNPVVCALIDLVSSFAPAAGEESALAAPGAHPVRPSARPPAAAPTRRVPHEPADTADPPTCARS